MRDRLGDEFSCRRREWLLASLHGAGVSLLGGCGKPAARFTGELLRPGFPLGHRMRASDFTIPATDKSGANIRQVEVAIVGGGMAGLVAGWRLQRAGFTDFCLFEMESDTGGTSRSGESPVTAYPWGAHYVPLPNAENTGLLKLLREMGAIRWSENNTRPMAEESVACREPQERLFVMGNWIEGLYPHAVASADDLAQWDRFRRYIHDWIDWRDPDGRPAFTIPLRKCSEHPDVLRLDRLTAREWLQQQQLDSRPLQWLIDYCCRDDYGLTLDQTSAWAAIFYFASRMTQSDEMEAPLLTWPAGNGEIVRHLTRSLGTCVETGHALVRIQPGDVTRSRPALLHVWDATRERMQTIQACQVILATPQFLIPYVMPDIPEERRRAIKTFTYGAWVVANLHLSRRPASAGHPLSWDNVIYESDSLGYVVATHQVGSDYGPTVWTWYYPLCDVVPARDRERLLSSTWEQWVEVVLRDLEPAHPDVRDCVQRIDIMQWGHAMIQPRPGFLWGDQRRLAAEPLSNIHFAGTDLSGMALMEEAFHHGVRAAEEVLRARNLEFSSFL